MSSYSAELWQHSVSFSALTLELVMTVNSYLLIFILLIIYIAKPCIVVSLVTIIAIYYLLLYQCSKCMIRNIALIQEFVVRCSAETEALGEQLLGHSDKD